MEAVILIGVQASGKSTFCKERLFDTHVRINLDMLRTRHRERRLLDACLEAKQRFVVDNTNPSKEERSVYISAAKAHGFRVIGYYFSSKFAECSVRNALREKARPVPLRGLLGTYGRLEYPELSEGFDELYYVQISPSGEFEVSEWIEEL